MRISDWSSDVCSSDLVSDPYLIARTLVGDADYFISHGSALELHRMVTQPQLAIIVRSEEHTSELQSLMRNSYAVFCLKTKIRKNINSYKTLMRLSLYFSNTIHCDQKRVKIPKH